MEGGISGGSFNRTDMLFGYKHFLSKYLFFYWTETNFHGATLIICMGNLGFLSYHATLTTANEGGTV